MMQFSHPTPRVCHPLKVLPAISVLSARVSMDCYAYRAVAANELREQQQQAKPLSKRNRWLPLSPDWTKIAGSDSWRIARQPSVLGRLAAMHKSGVSPAALALAP
jgi:hypothetical protein